MQWHFCMNYVILLQYFQYNKMQLLQLLTYYYQYY